MNILPKGLTRMQEFFAQLADIFRHDPGGRGLPGAAPVPDLAGLYRSLGQAENVLVITGFPVLKARAGETDGPLGAVNIARALRLSGKSVSIVTDRLNREIVHAAVCSQDVELPIITIPHEGAPSACLEVLRREGPSHVIAIERPGKCGGHFHSMRGLILDELVADTDTLFSDFSGVKIAVGDGGNELGMGALREAVLESVSNGNEILSEQSCDFPLAAGVSNWWGWGLAALLSLQAGKSLLPTEDLEFQMLDACVRAGAVDGMSGLCEHKIDGLSFEQNIEVLGRIRTLTEAFLEETVKI